MIGTGVVKHWELVVNNATGKHTSIYRNWNTATEAFQSKKECLTSTDSAVLYACSGKYGGHKIATYTYGSETE
jgi:hypothetical protein